MKYAIYDYSADTPYEVSLMSQAYESESDLQESISLHETLAENGEDVTEYEELLYEVKVTNEFLGHMYALQLFGLGLVFCIMLYKLVKNNVTRYI